MSQRTRIGRFSSLAARQVVYTTAHGLEVDEHDHFEIIRKRVLYEDVILVTYHRQAAWSALFWMGVLFTLSAVTAAFFVTSDPVVAITFGAISAAALVYGIVRLVLQIDVVTVFGRRSKAALHYRFRKALARRTYDEICANVAAAQERLARETAAMEPPRETVAEELPPMPAAE